MMIGFAIDVRPDLPFVFLHRESTIFFHVDVAYQPSRLDRFAKDLHLYFKYMRS